MIRSLGIFTGIDDIKKTRVANHEVHAMSLREPGLAGMGTTVSAARESPTVAITPQGAFVGWRGSC